MKVWVYSYVPYGSNLLGEGWEWHKVPVGPLQPGNGNITRAVRAYLQGTEAEQFALLAGTEVIGVNRRGEEIVRIIPGRVYNIWPNIAPLPPLPRIAR